MMRIGKRVSISLFIIYSLFLLSIFRFFLRCGEKVHSVGWMMLKDLRELLSYLVFIFSFLTN